MKNMLVVIKPEMPETLEDVKLINELRKIEMLVFAIPENLYPKYHGCGHAICAVEANEIVDFFYIRDVVDIDDTEEMSYASLCELLTHREVAHKMEELKSNGKVYVGMCSCYEFVTDLLGGNNEYSDNIS
jgi:hypothetical protein